jgi:GABA permease
VNNGRRREYGGALLVVGILGVIFVLFIAASVGLWAWLLAGAVIVVVGAVVLAALLRRKRELEVDAPPAPVPRAADDGVHHVLVVADCSCTSEDFRDRLVRRAPGSPTSVFVVAPAVGSRLSQWTGDQTAYSSAEDHLEATLGALAEMGVDATGRIGPHDPIQAADDGLRVFPADEIVFATPPDGKTEWLEDGVVERARERYDLPVTHVVVDAR